jgi:1,4-alpha-glucan branching enzyme
MNSDAKEYGGSGHGNFGGMETSPIPYHGRPHSINLTLPPLGVIFLKADE